MLGVIHGGLGHSRAVRGDIDTVESGFFRTLHKAPGRTRDRGRERGGRRGGGGGGGGGSHGERGGGKAGGEGEGWDKETQQQHLELWHEFFHQSHQLEGKADKHHRVGLRILIKGRGKRRRRRREREGGRERKRRKRKKKEGEKEKEKRKKKNKERDIGMYSAVRYLFAHTSTYALTLSTALPPL
jgi:hypothetical protein